MQNPLLKIMLNILTRVGQPDLTYGNLCMSGHDVNMGSLATGVVVDSNLAPIDDAS